MIFKPDGGSGAIGVALKMNKHFTTSISRTGRVQMGNASIEGGFTISGEFVSKMAAEFNELFKK